MPNVGKRHLTDVEDENDDCDDDDDDNANNVECDVDDYQRKCIHIIHNYYVSYSRPPLMETSRLADPIISIWTEKENDVVISSDDGTCCREIRRTVKHQ